MRLSLLLSRLGAAKGISTVEVTAVLSAMAMLSGMAAPAVNDYVNEAKMIKARSDVRVIATSFARFATDISADARRPGGWATSSLLVGAGAVPAVADGGDNTWMMPESAQVTSLDAHLVTNAAGYPAYDPRIGFGWRGAYINDGIAPDPWGRRYAVNVRVTSSATLDLIVLSAGPNGTIETPFERDGISPGGDDVLALVSSGAF